MAKKKKTTKRSPKKNSKAASKPQHILPGGFWAQVVAFVIFLVAILVIIAMFGIGGPLPTAIFKALRWTFGWAAFVSPLVLVYVSAQIFMAEENKVSFKVYAGCLVFMWALANFLQLFLSGDKALSAAKNGVGGGALGQGGNQIILQVITSKPAAGLLLFAVCLVALLFVLKIPLRSVLGAFFELFKREDINDNTDLAIKSAQLDEPQPSHLKLNENVPVQKTSRVTSLRNSIEQTDESREALTTTNDPNWDFPSLDLLLDKQYKADAGDVKHNADVIQNTLAEFNINVDMEEANIGPRVTQYALKPPAGVKLGRITALDTNLALNLAAQSIRIEAPIPGKRAVGIEVPNKKAALVTLKTVLSSPVWQKSITPLSFAIGKDIAGDPIIGDLDSMPHLLIAGQTGSGKSVMINTLLTSLLYHNSPADLKLILVDPKQVELTPYDNIPHLLTPVITKADKCISALKWASNEMERRYGLLAEKGKRNITSYNATNEDDHMPYIVIVIDELSDLMMAAARDVEALIVRIAQKSRAVGIHLVLATQRPSVDVITGLIKANVPARIAFTTTSQVDSRTIIDQAGAEKLLGKGDLLMTSAEHPKPRRIQGVFIEDVEVLKVTDFIKMQRPPEYDDEIVSQPVQLSGKGGIIMDRDGGSDDSLYKDAVQLVIESGKASTSLLQRRLQIGYGRASRLIDVMEDQGIIGPSQGAKAREILVGSPNDVFGDKVTNELTDEEPVTIDE
jgi:S-DNA-T family DNA segregation ATPase FtsK/SpoIIIE